MGERGVETRRPSCVRPAAPPTACHEGTGQHGPSAQWPAVWALPAGAEAAWPGGAPTVARGQCWRTRKSSSGQRPPVSDSAARGRHLPACEAVRVCQSPASSGASGVQLPRETPGRGRRAPDVAPAAVRTCGLALPVRRGQLGEALVLNVGLAVAVGRVGLRDDAEWVTVLPGPAQRRWPGLWAGVTAIGASSHPAVSAAGGEKAGATASTSGASCCCSVFCPLLVPAQQVFPGWASAAEKCVDAAAVARHSPGTRPESARRGRRGGSGCGVVPGPRPDPLSCRLFRAAPGS